MTGNMIICRIWENWMNSKKKNIINIFVLIILIVVTFYILMKNEDVSEIGSILRHVNFGFVMLAVIAALSRILGEAWNIWIVLVSQGARVTCGRCVKYAFIGFYFSAVTPSATGGQPAQIYYMREDRIPVVSSSMTLVLLAIAYRGVLVLLGIGTLVYFGYSYIKNFGYIRYFYVFGMIMNIGLMLFFYILLFSKKLVKGTGRTLIGGMGKIHILKNPAAFRERFDHMAKQYQEGADYIKVHKGIFTRVVLITFIQRVLMLFTTYAIYRAFGLVEASIIQIMLLQCIVSICADMLPLPGGVGANEGCYIGLFKNVFTGGSLYPSLLLSRGITFYALAIVSAVVMCLNQIKIMKLEKNSD